MMTNRRPSNGRAFVETSGGIAVFERAADRLFDGNLDGREHAERLRLPVFDNLKVVFRQIADEVALGIRDLGIDFDVVDVDFERQRRLRVRRRLLRRGLRRRESPREQERKDGCA